jgi:hypothetical protein
LRTHPDGVGGLGFLEQLTLARSPVVFAISWVLASRWVHEVLYHGVAVKSLRLPMLAFGVIALPAALPLLGVVGIEIPIRQLLLKILSTLA